MAQNGARPIIKKKKVAGHGGHHGGAWKVAYADFVTAMMAFFLVMWILGLSESTRHAIAGYFRQPGIFSFTTGKAQPVKLGMDEMAQHEGDGSGRADENSGAAAAEIVKKGCAPANHGGQGGPSQGEAV